MADDGRLTTSCQQSGYLANLVPSESSLLGADPPHHMAYKHFGTNIMVG